MRVVSVGISRAFRLCEVETGFRIEQAVRDSLTRRWSWRPLAFAERWQEAHGALHEMQAEWLDRMQRIQDGANGFRVDRYTNPRTDHLS